MEKEIRFRCWININGEKFFGPGPAELLLLIGEKGSITKAAKAMGMSYKKAWDIVDHLNAIAQKPYVISHKGGEKGGGAELTDAGRKITQEYFKLTSKINTMVEKNMKILNLV
jgi:molybdate transport system regulatory protein